MDGFVSKTRSIIVHVVAGANERRLYSQARARLPSFHFDVCTNVLSFTGLRLAHEFNVRTGPKISNTGISFSDFQGLKIKIEDRVSHGIRVKYEEQNISHTVIYLTL